MEIIRLAALWHFRNSSNDQSERGRIEQMFYEIDVDHNNAISEGELVLYLSRVLPHLHHHKASWFFRQLDRDRNGYLDFSEFLIFYYAISYCALCDCCEEVMEGPYYRCVICWNDYLRGLQMGGTCQPFEVCCRCYWSGAYRHQHSQFVDNYVLFRNMEAASVKKESSMCEILESGRLYYLALPDEDKSIANELFSEMDANSDGRVSDLEAISFLIRKGAAQADAYEAFQAMGITQHCSLTIENVVALWYAFVMRPCCKSCRRMINGSYYSCVTCFQNLCNSDTWDVCAECYRRGAFVHDHTFFLDNYVLLQISGNRGNLNTGTGSSSSTGQQIQGSGLSKIRQILKLMARLSTEAAISAVIGTFCTIM